MSAESFQFCDQCSAINFDAVVLDDFHWTDLGHLDEIYEKSSTCTFCGFIATVCKRLWPDNVPLTSVKGERNSCFINKDKNFLAGQEPSSEAGKYYTNYLYINIGVQRAPYSYPFGFCITPSPVPVPCSNEVASRRKVPRMSGSLIGPLFEPALLREWLNLCEGHHGDRCRNLPWLQGADWPRDHRVIDVRANKVIAAPKMCEYVALSYVWGRLDLENVDTRCTRERFHLYTQDGGLCRISLPRTITDAIELVRNLGERYLWNDALCIIQDDTIDLALQISQMDLIYARALFTIVAASGDSADSGISRIYEAVMMTEKRSTLGISVVGRSRKIFSQHAVWFFLENQVFWKCAHAVWKESVVREPTPHGQQGVPKYLLSNVAGGQFGDNNQEDHTRFGMLNLSRLVTQYQLRRFGQESDVVDAFQGILKRVTSVSSEVFHWGLPQSSFEQALLWISWSPVRQHEYYKVNLPDGSAYSVKIPSWSWMGWKCREFSHLIPHKYPVSPDPKIRRHPRVQWYKVDMEGSAMPLARPLQQSTPGKEIPGWISPYDNPPFPTHPEGTSFKDSGRIIAHVSYVTLRIQPLLCIEKRENKSHYISYLDNIYSVLDADGNRISKLKKWGLGTSHRAKDKPPPPQIGEFIVLSEYGRLDHSRSNSRTRRPLPPSTTPQVRPYTDWDTHDLGSDDDDAFFGNEDERDRGNRGRRAGNMEVDVRYELDLMHIGWNAERTVAHRVDLWSVWEDDWLRLRPGWRVVTLG